MVFRGDAFWAGLCNRIRIAGSSCCELTRVDTLCVLSESLLVGDSAMPKPILTFRDLDAWETGMETVLAVYGITRLLPPTERYVLSAQMRRAALSIPANIAEGHCRRSPRAYINHLKIALGSQAELETAMEVAGRLGLVDAATLARMTELGNRLRPLLHGLRP